MNVFKFFSFFCGLDSSTTLSTKAISCTSCYIPSILIPYKSHFIHSFICVLSIECRRDLSKFLNTSEANDPLWTKLPYRGSTIWQKRNPLLALSSFRLAEGIEKELTSLRGSVKSSSTRDGEFKPIN